MRTTGERAGYNGLSEILCNMCKTDDDDISEDLSGSDAEFEEDPHETENTKEFIPLERRVIREMRDFQGTHPTGGASLSTDYDGGVENDIDLDPPQFGDEQELEDNKTVAPVRKIDDMSADKSLMSCFTRRPEASPSKTVAFADLDDFSDTKSLRTLIPPEPPTAEEDQILVYDTDTSDFSEQSSYKTNKEIRKTRAVTQADEEDSTQSTSGKVPAKYTSMKDTLKRVTAELETTTMRDTEKGPYPPEVSNNPHQDLSEDSGEGSG